LQSVFGKISRWSKSACQEDSSNRLPCLTHGVQIVIIAIEIDRGEHMQKPATYEEIMTQPAAWEEAVAVVLEQSGNLNELYDRGAFREVILTGCGSTYYLSLAGAALWQEQTQRPARAVPAGELILYPKVTYSGKERYLLVAVSRSGATTETVNVARQFRAGGRGEIIVVTNDGESALAQLGDITLVIPSGQEQSVAQTRSFASLYVAVTATIATLARRFDHAEAMLALPEHGRKLMEEYEPLAETIGSDMSLDRFYFLGSGPRFGLACEVNLKMKEMTLTHSEAFHFFEFRHGPMSMVSPKAAVIGLVSEVNQSQEVKVLEEMRALGGRVLSVGASEADVILSPRLPEAIRNVLYLPVLQLMAYYRAIAKGLDPDKPTNLTAVVELDL
jgi:glucosamine--fructose-6-phosphate aminotransferase (isomerizing)